MIPIAASVREASVPVDNSEEYLVAVGINDSSLIPSSVSDFDGGLVGMDEVLAYNTTDGMAVGVILGVVNGSKVGYTVGMEVGSVVGKMEGIVLGSDEGMADG